MTPKLLLSNPLATTDLSSTKAPGSKALSVWRWSAALSVQLPMPPVISPNPVTLSPHRKQCWGIIQFLFPDTWITPHDVGSAIPICTPPRTPEKPLHIRNSVRTLNFPESHHSLQPVVVEMLKDFNQILLKDDPHHLLPTSFKMIYTIYHTDLNVKMQCSKLLETRPLVSEICIPTAHQKQCLCVHTGQWCYKQQLPMARAAEPPPPQGIHTQAGSEAKALCPGHHMYQLHHSLVHSQRQSHQIGPWQLSQPVLPDGCHNHCGAACGLPHSSLMNCIRGD